MYQAIVYIHIIAAITWLGGMLFLAMVMVPLARRDAGVGFDVLRDAARKFVPVAWASMVVLAVTGGYLAWTQWGIRPSTFFGGEGHFVQFLQMKTGLFVIVVLAQPGPRFLAGAEDDGPAGGGALVRLAAAYRPGAAVRAVGGPRQPAAGAGGGRPGRGDDAALTPIPRATRTPCCKRSGVLRPRPSGGRCPRSESRQCPGPTARSGRP